MPISGYWNLYKCNRCDIDFAIGMDKDKEKSPSCPHCEDSEDVTYEETDLIERY